ncbi:CaiB/BaiF CoA-transferase family protein [Sphingomonas sp. G-3-2-10]|uniref:CaiB/BaiF CoA transferase family protein n=1 Tax=Sphingomonas sp. G-3-2-10 TaxID=2728838 RepID=UPI00146D6269|nr:CaiB/BaiF CoA-transferase family protein [Sphingomonas sp. G-3-2-10]NML07243.1 CoA transferase [Sphingomonas sp. G-3-2-10]
MAGALAGLRIVEFAGIGPGPFCAMMLGDHGAEVIRIERHGGGFGPRSLARSRRSAVIDLKTPEGVSVARDLCRSADGVIEGFRPGVMERLGLGPELLIGDNPKLVYGRMTGWGQEGPLADAPGHDINYIAIAGVLEGIGIPGQPPVPPFNYVADYGGGGMMLAFGMLAALLSVQRGGAGQVVDAAMTDGAAMIAAMSWGMRAAGLWRDGPGATMLSGAAPFYRTYACSDGKFISVGAIEPQFWAVLVEGLGLKDDPDFASQLDPSGWTRQIARLDALFATRPRDEWVDAFDSTGACVAPILTMAEAAAHPHNAARGTFIEVGGKTEPAPAPRLSGTPADPPTPPREVGEDTEALLAGLGYSPERIAELRAAGTFR